MGIVSIRGSGVRAIAQAFHDNLVEDREKKEKAKRGPRVTVARTRRTKIGKSHVWKCYLECGHHVYRPIKRRRVGPGHDPEDHAPDWVYCEDCCD